MEALTSENALDEAVNEGNYQYYRSLPKTCLPHATKKHIFEGLDTSFISQDILKLPDNNNISPAPNVILLSADQLVAPEAEVVIGTSKKHGYQKVHSTTKYREFVRANSNHDQFMKLPVMQKRRVNVPTNYNSFLSSLQEMEIEDFDKEKPLDAVVRCSDNLIRRDSREEEAERCATIDKLMMQIDDVNRLMGRDCNRKVFQKRAKSRGNANLTGKKSRPVTRAARFPRHQSESVLVESLGQQISGSDTSSKKAWSEENGMRRMKTLPAIALNCSVNRNTPNPFKIRGTSMGSINSNTSPSG